MFAYDISRDKVRSRVSKVLERFGIRVQGSVFECRLGVERARRILGEIDLLREPGDSIRMYVIPEDARLSCETRGGAPISEASHFFLF